MNKLKDDVMFQAQLENLKKGKDLPLGEKIKFYWSFFKIQIIIIVFVICITISLISTIFFSADTYLYGAFANTNDFLSVSDEEFAKRFLNDISIDTKKNKMSFESSLVFSDQQEMYALSSLYTHISGAEMDFLVCTDEVLDKIGNNGMLAEIDTISELPEKYKNKIYLYNGKEIGIDISDSPVLKNEKAYDGNKNVIFCFCVNSPRYDRAVQFLEWLYKE